MAVTRREILARGGIGVGGVAVGAAIGSYAVSGSKTLILSNVSRSRPVTTTTEIPAAADVVVIGAGIAGISTAMSLRDRGMSVVVCEKGYVAGEQSSRAYGQVLSNGWHPDKLPIANRGKELWLGMSARCGADVGYRRNGEINLLSSDEEIAVAENWLKEALAVAPEMDSRIISGEALAQLMPNVGPKYKAALYQPSDGTMEPSYSIAMMAEAAQRAGAIIAAPVAVRSVEMVGGAISHVVTEYGAIRTRHVVVAGGAWSRLFLGNLGLALPQLSTLSSSMQRVTVANGPAVGAGVGRDYSWRLQADGSYSLLGSQFYSVINPDSLRLVREYLPAIRSSDWPIKFRFDGDFFEQLRMPRHWESTAISPFERARVLSSVYDQNALSASLKGIAADFPAFASAVVKERWGGLIDVMPDSTPVISEVPGRPGLMVCTGFSGAGITMGPAAGEMVAQIIAGEKPLLKPDIYRFSRFSDGSPLTLRTGF